jgi:hypothetical protein
MPSIVLVESNGTLKDVNLKTVSETELSKKYGLKNADVKHSWALTLGNKVYDITLYGKLTGRAGQENKYEFPPPVDTDLFFGKCVLVNGAGDITVAEWNRVYENLYGGFDDVGTNDSDSEEEDTDDIVLTKTGYMKDDFVVDDEEDEEEEEEEEEEDEVESSEEEEVVVTKKSKSKSKQAKKTNVKTKNKASSLVEPSYLDCTSELEEEQYI